MRFVKILVICGFSAACITALPSEDTAPPPKIEAKDIQEQKKDAGKEYKYGPRRVRIRCEYGCPATMPFVNIMPVFNHPDACRMVDVVDTHDATTDADAGVTSPDACGDIYEFGVCCGDGTCQPSESAFFCPQDCL